VASGGAFGKNCFHAPENLGFLCWHARTFVTGSARRENASFYAAVIISKYADAIDSHASWWLVQVYFTGNIISSEKGS